MLRNHKKRLSGSGDKGKLFLGGEGQDSTVGGDEIQVILKACAEIPPLYASGANELETLFPTCPGPWGKS